MAVLIPSVEETFPGTPPGVGQLRRAVGRLAVRCGMTARDVNAVQLAASEAATNAVIHAYRDQPGELRLEAHVEKDELLLVIADRGHGVRPRSDSPGMGFGLPIMAQVAKRFEIVSGNRGTEIHLAFACPAMS
jgi:stage II sporulation protein AB (anti-sigma F factor)